MNPKSPDLDTAIEAVLALALSEAPQADAPDASDEDDLAALRREVIDLRMDLIADGLDEDIAEDGFFYLGPPVGRMTTGQLLAELGFKTMDEWRR